ncbi:hypothetical protein AGMMS49579_25690 [Spirochaetia bacterium]|nr:hypothetical protein AGMMS49579_25690 [Spirochaetia bacterium]
MKNKWFAIFGVLLVFGLLFSACDTNEDDGDRNLKYSVQVNNKLSPTASVSSPLSSYNAARSIASADTVELYINNFEYQHDASGTSIILIAHGDRTVEEGAVLDNAGWYSVNADLGGHRNDQEGAYSSFVVGISKLRVNETEYTFPYGSGTVSFGHPSARNGGFSAYPDNFSGITITDSVSSLKTILTVEPDILDESGNLIADPYSKIKVEGRINQ